MEPSRSRPRSSPTSARKKSVSKPAVLRLDPRGLAAADAPALIGVSGGRDSVALLHALVERKQPLVVCHFDHALRLESGADAEFVRELAERLGLACEIGHWTSRGKQASLENAARDARYAFLASVAARRGCASVYLAHHADDQAETVLWNLLRGSGGSGLRGMRPTSERVFGEMALQLLRPLLGTWRSEIEEYVAAHQLSFREDSTNEQLGPTRNRLRRCIIPGLEEQLGRGVRTALWRAAEIWQAEEEVLDTLVPELPSGPVISVKLLRPLPLALQRRTLHRWLRAVGVAHVNFDDIENVRRLLDQLRPAKVNLSEGAFARRRAGEISIILPSVLLRN
jgi:tRNA(Ile)-lysidine synthase